MTSKLARQKGKLSEKKIIIKIKNKIKVNISFFRSCLRKIIEKDDTSSNKCIILFVSKIFDQISKNNLVG